MRLHHNDEGPPCKPMEPILHQVADGTAKGWKRVYAIWHAKNCPHCGTFLGRLEETLRVLHTCSRTPPPSDAMDRLKAGAWRNEIDR